MPSASQLEDLKPQIEPEDAARVHLYRLLAHFLSGPPLADDLALGAGLAGDRSELGTAIAAFAGICRRASPDVVGREYHDLFIGVGRGELVPFGSFYLSGFLQEKPLAHLRADMARLGLARSEGVHEPEDHIASVLEIMAGLVDRTFTAEGGGGGAERDFFDAHVASWAGQFFRDLEDAAASAFYAALGRIGRIFMTIETEAFRMT